MLTRLPRNWCPATAPLSRSGALHREPGALDPFGAAVQLDLVMVERREHQIEILLLDEQLPWSIEVPATELVLGILDVVWQLVLVLARFGLAHRPPFSG